jgi:hypothetical protein
MLRLVCVSFLIVVSVACYLEDHTDPHSLKLHQELIALSQRRFQAFFEGDRPTYERLLSSDAVFVYSNGRMLNRGQAMRELMPLAKPGTFTFKYEDVQFRNMGSSVALVYKLIFDGPPEIGHYEGITSDIWTSRNGAWQLVALHGTTVPYPNRTRVAVDSTLLGEYVGRYAMGSDVYYDITREGYQLMGQRNGFPKVPWLAESEVSFYVPSDPSATRIFMRDTNGHVSKLLRIEAAGNSVWTKVPDTNIK